MITKLTAKKKNNTKTELNNLMDRRYQSRSVRSLQ